MKVPNGCNGCSGTGKKESFDLMSMKESVEDCPDCNGSVSVELLDNTIDERSLFERLFDSNPDQPGTQFINLNPNR